jgi:hypothetical protein
MKWLLVPTTRLWISSGLLLMGVSVALFVCFVLFPYLACPGYCGWAASARLSGTGIPSLAKAMVVPLRDREIGLYCPKCRRKSTELYSFWEKFD